MLKSVQHLYYRKFYIHLLNIHNLFLVIKIIKLLYIILHMIFLNKHHIKFHILFSYIHIYYNIYKYIYKHL